MHNASIVSHPLQPSAMLIYPSLLSHTTLDHVLHPALALISEAPSVLSKLHPYSALKKPFPCDLHLVNCRTVFKSQPTVTEAALVLHRRGFDCGFKHSIECDLTNGQVGECDRIAKNILAIDLAVWSPICIAKIFNLVQYCHTPLHA